MTLDPRTPVLVGCGQVTQRAEDPLAAREQFELMADALERAAADAGSRELLAAADAIFVPRGLWRYANPGALLAEHFGAGRVFTGLGPISGSTVQTMLSRAAVDIAAGRRDVVLLAGAEAEHSRRRALAAGGEPRRTRQADDTPDEMFGSHDPGFGVWEARYRARPVQTFSLFENALRHRRGEDLEAHRARIADLWARFARVAAGNPYAWIQKALSAEEIGTPGPDNRMIAYPYTKYLTANMVVDQGAALLICSLEAARRHGVLEERMVFPQAATDARCALPVAERASLYDEPTMGATGRRALALAGTEAAQIGHVDLYSCFPAAVQIAAAELGFDLDRDLTVTGGLTFAGGPFNSYVLHAIATLMGRLRDDPGSLGFISSVGGYMAKHACGVYATDPPAGGFRHETLAEAAAPRVEWDESYTGPARVETFAQLPGRDGPDRVLAACLAPDGRRAWATSDDAELVASLPREELCGREVRVGDGVFRLGTVSTN